MKSFKRAYFAVGMTAMFAMAAPQQAGWQSGLPAPEAFALTVLPALVFATLLTWLSQFDRRYAGPRWLLPSFAVIGLVVVAGIAAPAFEWPAALSGETITAVPRLILFGLFCLAALQTQPASEHVEELS